jgi:hypothetical protein
MYLAFEPPGDPRTMIVDVKPEPGRPSSRAIVLETVSCLLVALVVGNSVGIVLFSLTFVLFEVPG